MINITAEYNRGVSMNIVRIICLLLVVFTALLLFACTNSNQAIVNNPTEAPTVEPTALPSLTPQPEITDSGELVEYTVSRSISNNMVVQRNSYFNVFGWSENIGGIIYAEFMGEKRYGVVNDSGEWMIEFSPHDATSEAQLLKIYPSNGKVTEYDNILIGDVWVVSGQSNAELTFAATIAKTPDYKNEISKEDKIRIFTQSRAGVLSVQKKIDISKAQDDVITKSWKWQVTTQGSVNSFSALGYYFIKELSKIVDDVPLGIIMAAAGGATLNELMPVDLAEKCGFKTGPTVPNGGFYNTLLHPFTKNSITGMIYYQGESEAGGYQYLKYAENLNLTVEAYRKVWGSEFAFINVQLSTHRGESFSHWPQLMNIRAAQFDAYKALNNSYIVTSMDQAYKKGEPDWAHPMYKFELGKRAATIAASAVYDKLDAEYAFCPEPMNIKWEDNSVTIDFKYVGDGLKLLDGDILLGFQIYDEFGLTHCDSELIDKDTVKITADEKIFGIAYGMTHNASVEDANLGNSLGYPLPAFEIKK